MQIKVRTADDLEHVSSRGLLFPRLVQFTTELGDLRYKAGTPDSRRRTIGALRRFGFCALRLRALASLLLALERRRIAIPKA